MQTNFRLFNLIILLVCAFYVPTVHAQIALKKGDRVPEMILRNVFNTPKKELNLSTINSKLILFDFWSPNCTACLMSFPKLDSLQSLFGDEISIILVNQQSHDSTKRFFDQRKFLYKPNLAFITSDTVLNLMFPNLGNPAYAWLDGNGKFYQMSDELTADGIRNFISQQNTGLADYRVKRRYVSSLFDAEFRNHLLSYSYLTRAIPGLNLSGEIDRRGISKSNYSILDLYKEAYSGQLQQDFNKPWKIELIVKDSSKYIEPSNSDSAYRWRQGNLYTYSLLLPEEKAGEKYSVMQKDLDRYLSLESKVESKMVQCLALIRTSTRDKLKTNTKNKSKDISLLKFGMSDLRTSKIDAKRELINRPYHLFSELFGAWVEFRLQKPFLDLTGYIGNIDISFKGEVVDRFDLIEIRKALKLHDLDLIEKECSIDVLVLREAKQ